MAISGERLSTIQDAFLDAYRSVSDLSIMVRMELGENLNEIVQGKNLQETVFGLIDWSDAQGRLPELITGAYKRNPKNPKLSFLIKQIGTEDPEAGLTKSGSTVLTPLGKRRFTDKKITEVIERLEELHNDINSTTLPMHILVPELDILFDRKTFRYESVEMCISQLWGERLHTAYQTFEVLRAYQRNVRDEGMATQYSLYQELLANVSSYCMNMGVYLFEPPIDETYVKDYIGTLDFKSRLTQERKFVIYRDGLKMTDLAIHHCDSKRESAIQVMNNLCATVK